MTVCPLVVIRFRVIVLAALASMVLLQATVEAQAPDAPGATASAATAPR